MQPRGIRTPTSTVSHRYHVRLEHGKDRFDVQRFILAEESPGYTFIRGMSTVPLRRDAFRQRLRRVGSHGLIPGSGWIFIEKQSFRFSVQDLLLVVLGPYFFCKSHRCSKPVRWLDPGISRL